MKANILCGEDIVLRDVDVVPNENNTYVVLSDVNVETQDWGDACEGWFRLPVGWHLELTRPHFIEFEGHEPQEITFNRVTADYKYVVVWFVLRKSGGRASKCSGEKKPISNAI